MAGPPAKLLLLLAARGGVTATGLRERARATAEGLSRRLAGPGTAARALVRVADDPFAAGGAAMRAFDATLELRADDPALLLEAAAGAGERIADWVHVDLSAALLGVEHPLVPCAPTPFRYQYVMRRRADLDHAGYLDHYLHRHADFGRRTPGIRGYVQFHVDPEGARAAAGTAGLGLWAADSVSELHLDSVEGFLQAVATWPGGAEATADEERFVDRANSVMFCSEVVG